MAVTDNPYSASLTPSVAGEDAAVADDLTVGDDVTIGGDLTVTGAITSSGGLSFGGGVVINEPGADADTRVEGLTDTELLFIDASTDRVGISTLSPTHKFHVEGNSSLDGSLNVNVSGADVDTVIAGDTDASLLYVDAGNDRVGIGTATPSHKLDVVGTTEITGATTVTGNTLVTGDTTLNGAVSINTSGADKDTIIQGDTDTTLLFVDAGNDRVGIGTGTPSHKLDVVGTLEVTGASSLNGAVVVNASGADVDTQIQGDTDVNLLYTDAGNDRVGIGTATPGTKLDVVGVVRTNNQLVSTLAIGTQPLDVTSTTVCTNLNADQVDGADLSTTTTLGTSDVLVPSQNAVKTYVDNTAKTGLYANAIINPDGALAMRGASGSATFTAATTPANNDDTYLIDRWILLSDGNDIVDVSQSTDAPDGSQYSIKFLVATANKRFGIFQVIENKDSIPLDDQYVSISFAAKTTGGAVVNNLRACVYSWSGAADTVTSDIVSNWQSAGNNITPAANWTAENTAANIAITTSWDTYTIENILIDTASMANIGLFIYVDDDNCDVNDELYVGQIQLIRSPIALTYQPRATAIEQELCARFYQKSYLDTVAIKAVTNVGVHFYNIQNVNNADHEIDVSIEFNTHMRIAPTMTLYGPGTGNSGKVIMTAGEVNGATNYESNRGFTAYGTNGAAATTRLIYFHWTADAEL